jgi:CheY-like chemotaxis protein
MSWIDYSFTFGFLLVTLLFGLIFVWWHSRAAIPFATLWSMACLACGAIIGFLFGIPRVLQGDVARVPAEQPGSVQNETASNPQVTYQQQVNTNLEQISDWLTKIIVGIGLIELRRLPELLNRSSTFIGQGLGAAPGSQSLAAAIIIYFGLIGFLNSYMITRIYLAGAFKRADTGADRILNVGGNTLKLAEAAEQQGNLIGDLLERVSGLQANPTAADDTLPATASNKAMAGKQLKVHSILWVDDNPKNNSYVIESLGKRGITVVTSLSTTEALSKLGHQKFDRIISDMGRKEGASYNETAGIDLIKKVRETDPDTPIIVHCSTQAAAKYRSVALEAGANEVTPSPSFLLTALRLDD